MYYNWYKYRTNCIIQGTIRQGKSKLAEDCARDHIANVAGYMFMDWHGASYTALRDFLAYIQPPDQKVICLDLSAQDFIVPWNPFALPNGHDISAHVNRMVSLLLKLWGSKNANETPTLERVASMLFYYCASTGEPLHHGVRLLRFHNKHLRECAIAAMDDDDIRDEWEELNATTTVREWKAETLSTRNRVGRFIRSKAILRSIGLKGESLDISKAIDEQSIILVNLQQSGSLDADSARMFAALLLSEFLHVAVENAHKERPYWICCDEAQEYVTDDAASMLDQAMKAGLRLTLIHHHAGQFKDRPKLMDSMEMNARIRCVFAGLPIDQAERYAKEFYLEELNMRKVKERFSGIQTVGYKDAPFEHRTAQKGKTGGTSASAQATVSSAATDSKSASESWHPIFDEMLTGDTEGSSTTNGRSKTKGKTKTNGWTEGEGTVRGTRQEPILEEHTTGVQDYTLDEKTSMIAERIRNLKEREYILRLPDRTDKRTVRTVKPYLISAETRLDFELSLLPQMIPVDDVDQRLIDQKKTFLEGTDHEPNLRTRRAKKNRPLSHE